MAWGEGVAEGAEGVGGVVGEGVADGAVCARELDSIEGEGGGSDGDGAVFEEGLEEGCDGLVGSGGELRVGLRGLGEGDARGEECEGGLGVAELGGVEGELGVDALGVDPLFGDGARLELSTELFAADGDGGLPGGAVLGADEVSVPVLSFWPTMCTSSQTTATTNGTVSQA